LDAPNKVLSPLFSEVVDNVVPEPCSPASPALRFVSFVESVRRKGNSIGLWNRTFADFFLVPLRIGRFMAQTTTAL
jgi:hypothetical protein